MNVFTKWLLGVVIWVLGLPIVAAATWFAAVSGSSGSIDGPDFQPPSEVSPLIALVVFAAGVAGLVSLTWTVVRHR